MHGITLFFHGTFDENVFIRIRTHQYGLERREQHPVGVQQEKLHFMFHFMFMMCDTFENPIFLCEYNGNVFS